MYFANFFPNAYISKKAYFCRLILMKASFFTLLVCIIVYNPLKAQLDNQFFHLDYFDQPIDSGKWQLSFDNFSYFRNTEQLSKVHYGRSYIGTHFLPTATYQINDKAKISGGAFMRYDFGNPGFKEFKPFFQFSYKLWNHDIIFGSLQGNVQHEMVEPIFEYERVITRRLEEGAQIKFDNKRWKYEIWIDWETMIYQNSPFNESFVAGYNVFYKPINRDKHILRLNSQAMTLHQAGEIDLSPVTNVMFYNFAHGLDYQWKPNENFDLFASFYGVYHEDQSGTTAFHFIDGLGQLATLRLQYKGHSLVLNYWDAHEYQAPLGEGLYRSSADKNPDNPIRYRKMAMARLVTEKKITENLTFLTRLGCNYNIDHSAVDVIMENFLRFNIRGKQRYLLPPGK